MPILGKTDRFYCAVYSNSLGYQPLYGKPLFECIASFFVGGLILGIITHRTQSIADSLAVHPGDCLDDGNRGLFWKRMDEIIFQGAARNSNLRVSTLWITCLPISL